MVTPVPKRFQRWAAWKRIGLLVNTILEAKTNDPHSDTSILETQIDHLVYELHGLTEEEIGIVEGWGAFFLGKRVTKMWYNHRWYDGFLLVNRTQCVIIARMIKRESQLEIAQLLEEFPAIAVLGPRQIGKTT